MEASLRAIWWASGKTEMRGWLGWEAVATEYGCMWWIWQCRWVRERRRLVIGLAEAWSASVAVSARLPQEQVDACEAGGAGKRWQRSVGICGGYDSVDSNVSALERHFGFGGVGVGFLVGLGDGTPR